VAADNSSPRRLTPPSAFPDLDAALAARGIAIKASAPLAEINDAADASAEASPAPRTPDFSGQQHPAAFLGAVLGLLLIGLLVFSVGKVSHDAIEPPNPVRNAPSLSTYESTPVVAAPPVTTPIAGPPGLGTSDPQAVAATPVAVPPPTSPSAPVALAGASTLTAQTMTIQPPPSPQDTANETLRSRLHEFFPRLFPDP
jgi:hypothetical protein